MALQLKSLHAAFVPEKGRPTKRDRREIDGRRLKRSGSDDGAGLPPLPSAYMFSTIAFAELRLVLSSVAPVISRSKS